MFKNNMYPVQIDIKLENGLYQFNCVSATGKTRLYYLLKDLTLEGVPVIAYSYNEYEAGISLETVIGDRKPQVILIDRYDMFLNKYKDLLLELSRNCIVLIDCKTMLQFGEYYRVCGIKMTPEKIEVYG